MKVIDIYAFKRNAVLQKVLVHTIGKSVYTIQVLHDGVWYSVSENGKTYRASHLLEIMNDLAHLDVRHYGLRNNQDASANSLVKDSYKSI